MSVDVTETAGDEDYNDGYDDGYNGYSKRSNEPDYLQGFYDGREDNPHYGADDYEFYWD